MKTKKIFTILLSIGLICAIAISLSACLKIGLQTDKVYARLQEEGATVEYVRSTPMTIVGQDAQSLDDMLRATKEIDGIVQTVYIIYSTNQDSAEWVEERCRAYKEEQLSAHPEPAEGETDYNEWIVYTYDYMVMIGHYKMVSLARTY